MEWHCTSILVKCFEHFGSSDRFCLKSHQKTHEQDAAGFFNSFSEELIENYLVPTGNITVGCSYI